MTGTLLSIGHGYSARELAQSLEPGWRVIGTSRSAEGAEALRRTGIEARIWPGDDLGPDLAAATHLMTSVPPGASGDPVLAALGETLRAARHLRWVGYLSTTGVYGDHGGDWVDETAPLTPATSRGEARVAAEAGWAALGLPLHIFRLAGIYGPGRSPLDRVREGRAQRIVKEGQVFSRIHVADIAQVLAASMAAPDPGAIYNLADDEPAPPDEVIAFAAEMLGLPVPPAIPFEKAELSPMARSFYAESKRVRNDRIKTELGVHLRHPDYRAGLAALLETERAAMIR
ncbi:SDR family oxidoreductase [Rhodovulum sulfidophilum]|uniref:SDR family oxidoreductase n=1 Tax=Rhodovulum sulfidophilum TaxID=35806 RepID=UPI0005AA4A49|nr:SDR family oxidoreductase [Rhodovulum sulfidophilum]ANB33135.1 NAD(P)-dependent oxidoreductase [Rhodovulum sulfidophilum DSM 1374]ANB36983.1 NAD(P)-dependent oxidoreductase [Rhodovulum sulfidophilum]MBL3563032.1 SDR family oxidoreductase [Rhodovulum sulfidophilum]MCW2302446.1 nucleoside-diphosphate-sugar epimerase [Rhodovulum sulfidophilum]OLS53384.1 NAD(P)-dependent oxidoreductase [Rhodovulum sulfidophilum]